MKFFNPLTTATSTGVTLRYLTTIVGTLIAILGVLNWLTPAQVLELSKQVPELFGAVAALITAIVPLYAVLTKSSSDRAAEVAKQVDAQVPVSSPVVIKTPPNLPDIVVPAKK